MGVGSALGKKHYQFSSEEKENRDIEEWSEGKIKTRNEEKLVASWYVHKEVVWNHKSYDSSSGEKKQSLKRHPQLKKTKQK